MLTDEWTVTRKYNGRMIEVSAVFYRQPEWYQIASRLDGDPFNHQTSSDPEKDIMAMVTEIMAEIEGDDEEGPDGGEQLPIVPPSLHIVPSAD